MIRDPNSSKARYTLMTDRVGMDPFEAMEGPWLVRFVRKVWPKQKSVIGQTIHAHHGAKTITSGDIYSTMRSQP